MRRDRNRDRRDEMDEYDGDDNNPNSNSRDGGEEGPTEMQLRALWLLDEVIRMTPRNDVRLGYLMALREQLETDEAMLEEAKKVIAEFEEAYTKLTSPANRIGVFLGKIEPEKKPKPRRRFGQPAESEVDEKPDQSVSIALGGHEYMQYEARKRYKP